MRGLANRLGGSDLASLLLVLGGLDELVRSQEFCLEQACCLDCCEGGIDIFNDVADDFICTFTEPDLCTLQFTFFPPSQETVVRELCCLDDGIFLGQTFTGECGGLLPTSAPTSAPILTPPLADDIVPFIALGVGLFAGVLALWIVTRKRSGDRNQDLEQIGATFVHSNVKFSPEIGSREERKEFLAEPLETKSMRSSFTFKPASVISAPSPSKIPAF